MYFQIRITHQNITRLIIQRDCHQQINKTHIIVTPEQEGGNLANLDIVSLYKINTVNSLLMDTRKWTFLLTDTVFNSPS